MENRRIGVLVVEDSLLFRSLLVKCIDACPDLMVVGVAADPFEARDRIIECRPDVMTLDVELPRMNGIEFLKKLMPQYPVRTVVISALNDKVFDAMKAGAVDFLAKPIATDRNKLNEFLQTELPDAIRIAAKARIGKNLTVMSATPIKATQLAGAGLLPGTDASRELLVAIGASTGGTEATSAVLDKFGSDMPGIVITQHMPEGFTAMYAGRLKQQLAGRLAVSEAVSGEKILPGHVYIAPGGDCHMEVIRKGSNYYIQLTALDKVNGHRPSVDVLFNSVAAAAGSNAVGIILTGMGGDGAQGLLNMRRCGARTIGQDESTCVVYGMPKVAYEKGAVEFQEKLGDIPGRTYYLLEKMQKRKEM